MQRRRLLIPLAFALSLLLVGSAEARSKKTVLYTFSGGGDGGGPSSDPIFDASGNLYGTTFDGGDLGCGEYGPGCGVVFELMPSTNGQWQEKVLYAFQGGPDGYQPSGNLILDTAGNLYGTTFGGGNETNCQNGFDHGCGTVFELSPNPDGSWTKTTLYSFQGGKADAANPSGLIMDPEGQLYGATFDSREDQSTIFELTPPIPPNDSWTETVLYNFTGPFNGDGWGPNGALVFDNHYNLYGTTQYGGISQHCILNCGTVFELKHAGQGWKDKILYDFRGGGNGYQPWAGVVFDKEGNLYGTTVSGGNNEGIAFELKHVNGRWKEQMLYNFCSRNYCADGFRPNGLTMDRDEILYGTTEGPGGGLIFRLGKSKNGWKETVLYTFKIKLDGWGPSDMVLRKGVFYGTTGSGGIGCVPGGCGTVFEFTP